MSYLHAGLFVGPLVSSTPHDLPGLGRKSPLLRNLAETPGSPFFHSHDEGIAADLKDVVGRLGPPLCVGSVAVDLLPEHLERHPRLPELLEGLTRMSESPRSHATGHAV